MNQVKADEIRQRVRASYSEVAEASDAGECCGEQSSCCGVSSDSAINALVSTRMGYSEQDLGAVPVGADRTAAPPNRPPRRPRTAVRAPGKLRRRPNAPPKRPLPRSRAKKADPDRGRRNSASGVRAIMPARMAPSSGRKTIA